jgi:hypothetical protein
MLGLAPVLPKGAIIRLDTDRKADSGHFQTVSRKLPSYCIFKCRGSDTNRQDGYEPKDFKGKWKPQT